MMRAKMKERVKRETKRRAKRMMRAKMKEMRRRARKKRKGMNKLKGFFGDLFGDSSCSSDTVWTLHFWTYLGHLANSMHFHKTSVTCFALLVPKLTFTSTVLAFKTFKCTVESQYLIISLGTILSSFQASPLTDT